MHFRRRDDRTRTVDGVGGRTAARRDDVVSASTVQEDDDSLLKFHYNKQQITGLPGRISSPTSRSTSSDHVTAILSFRSE